MITQYTPISELQLKFIKDCVKRVAEKKAQVEQISKPTAKYQVIRDTLDFAAVFRGGSLKDIRENFFPDVMRYLSEEMEILNNHHLIYQLPVIK